MDLWSDTYLTVILISAATLCPGTSGDTTDSIAGTEPPGITTESSGSATTMGNVTTDETGMPLTLLDYGADCCLTDNETECASANTVCTSCQCQCKANYTYQLEKSVCTEAILEDGRLPNEPCDSFSDCIEGLVCIDSICACPSPCEYVEEKLVCDCGYVDAMPAIVAGVVLGLMIVFFWVACIISTVQKHKQQQVDKVSQLARRTSGISTLGAVYGTDHLAHPRGPATPRLPHHTVAPMSPLRPPFRSKQMTTADPGHSTVSVALITYSTNNSAFLPSPQLNTSNFSQYKQGFGGDNTPYKFSASKPPVHQCPASAPEGRRLSASDSWSGPSPPSEYQPPSSARF